MSTAADSGRLPIAQLAIQPFAGTDARDLRALAAALTTRVGELAVAPPAELPRSAFDARRGQYRAERLLDLLESREHEHVLGVTAADLYAGGLNFVFGIATPAGRKALVSLARLGMGTDRAGYVARMLKEAVHELGHALGLGHCADARCVMRFSNSLADTDAKGDFLCARCRKRLESREALA